jgi:hypothetical protein
VTRDEFLEHLDVLSFMIPTSNKRVTAEQALLAAFDSQAAEVDSWRAVSIEQRGRADRAESLLAEAVGALAALDRWSHSDACKSVEASARIHGVHYRPEDVECWEQARSVLSRVGGGK